jgi:hypothetical protein
MKENRSQLFQGGGGGGCCCGGGGCATDWPSGGDAVGAKLGKQKGVVFLGMLELTRDLNPKLKGVG